MELNVREHQELAMWATNIKCWGESAQAVLTGGEDIKTEIELGSDRLVHDVRLGSLSVGDLRAGVVWANALDAEAVRAHGADIEAGEDTEERTARRIMHLAGRTALEQVKNHKKLTALRVRGII